MTNRERERKTLDFAKQSELDGRGSIEETFYPWVLTTQRFKKEGMPADIADGRKCWHGYCENQRKISEVKVHRWLQQTGDRQGKSGHRC